MAIRHDQKTFRDLAPVAGEKPLYDFDLVRGSFILQSQQYNASMGQSRPKHLLPKVLVCGYEDSVFLESPRKVLVITYATRFFKHREDIKILLTQPPCQGGTCALVYQ